MMSEIAESSLMLASYSVFWVRWTCQVCSRVSCFRERSNECNSWIACSGTKLTLIRPQLKRSSIHMASFMSVLRPGTFLFLMCAAWPPSTRTCRRSKCSTAGFHRRAHAPALLQSTQQRLETRRRRLKRPALSGQNHCQHGAGIERPATFDAREPRIFDHAREIALRRERGATTTKQKRRGRRPRQRGLPAASSERA